MREVPASVGQRLLSLMDHYRGRDSALNEQVVWRIRGPYDHDAMCATITDLTRRHEILRTTYTGRAHRLTQRVHDAQPVPVTLVETTADEARARLAAEVTTPIDASVWPTRATVLRIAPDHHVVSLTVHHYASDDYSNAVLSRDLRALYRGEELPGIGWQYADWARWQQGRLSGDNLAKLTDYWRTKLSGARLVDLPARGERDVPAGEPPWVSVEHVIDAETTAALREFAKRHRTTLFPVTLALFYALLHHETRQDDLTVASLFANRDRPEVRESVGFFVSMVLLRDQLSPHDSFDTMVARLRRTVTEAMRHQDLPYQLLPPNTIEGSSARTDDVLFQLLGSFLTRADMAGEELDDLEAQLQRRRFALEFVLVPQGDALAALLLCARNEFDPAWADGFVRDYVALATRAVHDADTPLSRLHLARTA